MHVQPRENTLHVRACPATSAQSVCSLCGVTETSPYSCHEAAGALLHSSFWMCSSVLWCLDLLCPPPGSFVWLLCPVRPLLPKPKSQFHGSSTSPNSGAVLPPRHTANQKVAFHTKGNINLPKMIGGDAFIEPWVFFTPALGREEGWFGLQLFQKFYMRGKCSPALNDLSRAVSASWQKPLLKHQRASLPLPAQHCCQWLSSFYKSSCSRVQKPNNNLKMYNNDNVVVLMVRRSQISIIGVLMLRLVAWFQIILTFYLMSSLRAVETGIKQCNSNTAKL